MLNFLTNIVNSALDYAMSKLEKETPTSTFQTQAPPMYYDGQSFFTIGDFINYSLNLAEIDLDKAQDFFHEYINWIYDVSRPRVSLERARQIAVSNFKRRAWQSNAEIYGILMDIIRPYNQ